MSTNDNGPSINPDSMHNTYETSAFQMKTLTSAPYGLSDSASASILQAHIKNRSYQSAQRPSTNSMKWPIHRRWNMGFTTLTQLRPKGHGGNITNDARPFPSASPRLTNDPGHGRAATHVGYDSDSTRRSSSSSWLMPVRKATPLKVGTS